MTTSAKRQRSDENDSFDGSCGSDKLIGVQKFNIPVYLHNSEFYLSLQDDEESILIPSNCMKMDDAVNTNDQLHAILMTLRFWVAPVIVDTVFDFLFQHPFESYESVLSDFSDEFPALMHIKSVIEALSKDKIYKAARIGMLELADYLHKLGHPWPNPTTIMNASQGNIIWLQKGITAGVTLKLESSYAAAEAGYLDCLKILHENGCPWDERTCTIAALYNRLDCLMYLHENGCPWEDNSDDPDPMFGNVDNHPSNVCTIAGYRGHLACLQYAHSQGVPLVRKLLYEASYHTEALGCMQYALDHGVQLNDIVTYSAAQSGNLDVLKFLHERNCPWHEDTCQIATAFGHFDCLKFAHENGAPWNESVCMKAVDCANIDVVIYLLRNGCPPSSNLCLIDNEDDLIRVLTVFIELNLPWAAIPEATLCAVTQEFLKALQFMVQNGCPWHPRCAEVAAGTGRLDILQYVHESGCHLYTSEEDKAALCTSAINNNAFDCLVYAHKHGCVIPSTACEDLLTENYDRDCLDCFKYAHMHGKCPLYKNYTEEAARRGNLALLRYLHGQGCKWDAKAAVAAAKEGHAECLEYLLNHGCDKNKGICITATKNKHEECLAVAYKYGCV